jgi:uncharacterized protein
MTSGKTRVDRFAEGLAARQAAHPKRFLVVAGAVTAIAGIIASGLRLDSSYEALLPKDSWEIQNSDRVRDLTGGTRQIVVAVKGKRPEARLAFARRLAEELSQIDEIRFVDLEFPVSFFEDRALWLMTPAALDELIPALEEAVRVSKWQANPMNLHLDEKKEKEELEAAWRNVDDVVKKHRGSTPFKRVLTSKDGQYTFILLIPSIKFIEVEVGRALSQKIQDRIDALHPEKAHLEVRLAGNLSIMQEQNRVMVTDLRAASVLAFGVGIFLVAFAMRRVGAPFLIGIALLAGVAWTFAFARIAIGHLNIITGFLVAVLIGLGIDFGIHLFMRFQQELRLFNRAPAEAMYRATTETLQPALTSALTTAGTFFTFVIAEFRGFSEFGLIAGVGVICTIASSFVILPPLILVVGVRHKRGENKAPKPLPPSKPLGLRVALPVAIVFIGAAVWGAFSVNDIPFRNNLRKLRGASPATDFMDYVDKNLGVGFNPAVFVASSVEDADTIEKIAKAQMAGGFDGRKSRISRVLSITDLLPRDIDALRPRIARLREILLDPKLDRAEEKGGKRAEQLARARRMAKAEPWTIQDLPEVFKRRMTTLDGKQYLVLLWPNERTVDSDRIAVEWEDELDHLAGQLDEHKIKYLEADETLLLAWIYRTILADALPLLVLASVVVLLLLLADFRNPKDTLFVAFPLATGIFAFLGIVHAFGMELNMFNMIVLPSIIGIGIDNSVHIYHRYKSEGRGSVRLVIRTTGMATLLASVTTGIGFGSALIAHNVGLKSLGLLATIGISCTFAAAVLFFPCMLSLLERLPGKGRRL